jgi:hypothetical protein
VQSAARARGTFLLLIGALVAWQAVRWGLTPHGLVSSWDARPAASTVSAATPRPVQQTFLMGADGLDGVWLDTRTDGRPPVGDLVVDLFEVTPVGVVRLERAAMRAAEAVRGGRVHVRFRPIRASRGHRYRLDVRHVHAEPGPAVELAVTREDRLPGMSLVTDGIERWGDLVLHTTSRRATLPYWTAEILAPWPAWVRSPVTIIAAVLLLNAGLALACVRAAGLVGVPGSSPGGVDAEPVGAPRVRWTATAAVLAVAGSGAAGAMWPTPSSRTLDLIAALPDARIDTTWPSIHSGVSPESVVFESVVYEAIIAMPTTRLAWTIDVPPGAVFRSGAAMRADMWTRNSDGIQMAVTVEHARGKTVMAHLTLFPLGVPEHRKLFPVEVPLHPWAGQRVTLVLDATPERFGNAVNDVPVWVAPRIEWPRRAGAVDRPIVAPR